MQCPVGQEASRALSRLVETSSDGFVDEPPVLLPHNGAYGANRYVGKPLRPFQAILVLSEPAGREPPQILL
jgi:hypothetical protein